MCCMQFVSSAQDSTKIDTTKKNTTNSFISNLKTRNVILSTNMVELLVKGPNLMYEQVIRGNKGITAKLVYDVSPDINMIYLESSYRYYFWKPNGDRLLTGLSAGPYVKLTQQLSGKKRFVFGVGAEAAFKWIWYDHYVLEPSVTISYPYLFDLRIGFGYAF